MADRLLAFCRFMKNRSERDWDNAILIDGQEGTGKSTLGAWIKAGYDGYLNLAHVVYDGNDLMEQLEIAPDGSCIWIDEGKDAANRRRWYSDLNIALGEALSIIRDKNYLLIVNIPRSKELDTHIINRFHYRFWVYSPNKQDRGYCHCYEFVDTPFAKQSRWQRLLWHYKFPKLPDWFEREYYKFKRENLDRKVREYRERALAKEKKEKRQTKREIAIGIVEDNPKISVKALAKKADISLNYARDILKTTQT
jgi:hypothetical protein